MASGFSFNLERSAILQAVKWERLPGFRWLRFFKKVFLILFVLSFPLFLYGFLTDAFLEKALSRLFGLSLISFSLFLASLCKESFLNGKVKKPKLLVPLVEAVKKTSNFNLADFLSFEVAKAVFESYRFAQKRQLKEPNSSILLYRLLLNNPSLNFVFSRALLDFKEIKEVLKNYLEKLPAKTPTNFQETIEEGFLVAKKRGHERLEKGDVLVALAKTDLIFKKILVDSNLQAGDIENLTWWLESLEKRIRQSKRFWAKESLIRQGSLAKQWAAGFTVTLDNFSIDLTEVVKAQGFPETVGHQAEIQQIERVLARREINNVLLVGEPGVGKKAIIQGLATRSALGQSLPKINYKRIVALDIPAILAQVETREEVQAILDRIFQEILRAGNVILTINDFHNFVRTETQPGVIDVSGILSSYLALPQFQLIGITTFQGLHRYIERKPGALDFFEKVEASEISERETLMLLERMALGSERKNKTFISYPVLREIISLADRYLPAIPFPKKAISLLDEVMVYVSSIGEKIVLPEHVARIISEKTQIPVGEIEIKEKEILLNLEDLIHKRIINQEEAVREVSSALRRARAEVTTRKGPMGTFLFLGPTGVGKTETAKALSEIYFGSENRMLRFDMSEFQNVGDIPRLIGSAEEQGVLSTQVRENPFALVLLDEIEKAHKNILNLFLQVLDEGFLTDGLGRKVDFKNTIIIATSNAGYQIILEALRQKSDWDLLKQKMLDYLFAEAIFRPEFINRFDAVVLFKALSKENLLDISELMLKNLQKNLKEKGVELVITMPLKEKIVELGYDPTFGARQMRRVIQDKVENVLASALLSGELKRGDKAEVQPKDFTLNIS